MRVLLRCSWYVPIYNKRNVCNVESTSANVCAYEHGHDVCSEQTQRSQACSLCETGVQSCGTDAKLLE